MTRARTPEPRVPRTTPALAVAVLATCVAAGQLALTTGRVAVAAVAAVVGLAALAHRRRLHAGSAGEVLMAISIGGVGTVLHGLAPEQNGLGSAPLRSAMFVFAFTGLAMAALRLHLDRPEGGLPGTLAAAGLVFLACGTVRTEAWLPRLFAVYLALAFAAIALDLWQRGQAPAPWRLRGRHAAVALLIVAVVPGLMWGWGRGGPKLVRASTSAVLDLFAPLHRTGFHDGPISLHALDGLSESNAVVLRVAGSIGGHLRGNVYLTYEQGRWVPLEAAAPGEVDPLRLAEAPGPQEPSARIEYVSEETSHFFLPLGARPFAVEPDTAVVDAWQLVRADEQKPSLARVASLGGGSLAPAPPGALDLQVPERVRAPLEAVRDAWLGAGARGTHERARRLESMLATEFEYATSFRDAWGEARRRRPKVDPVVLFLEDVRKGHCEYFASALALLLRTDGVPARLVSGYRVAERNPYGGWAVVRERHAHAWVEAYLPGRGWTTLDGTPLAAATATDGLAETPRLAAIIDWLSRQAHVHGRTVLLVVLVVGLATAQVVRLVRGRQRSGRGAGNDARRASKALQAMLSRLADAGFERGPGESLEGLARRLRAPDDVGVASPRSWPEPAFFEAADLLDRYAALRYGDVGHRPSVESALARWPEPAS